MDSGQWIVAHLVFNLDGVGQIYYNPDVGLGALYMEGIMQLTFEESTLEKLDNLFGLEEVRELSAPTEWLAGEATISDYERQTLEFLQGKLIEHVRDWNETELTMEFIGPLMGLVNYSHKKFNFFAQRIFEGKVDGVGLSGKPDGIIASGKRSPHKPYFCFQEYKREQDPEGDPAGQVLAAMLLAQEVNEYEHPIYGCYVKGDTWYFVLLQGKKYTISVGYVATSEKLFEIFGILQALKPIIRGLLS